MPELTQAERFAQAAKAEAATAAAARRPSRDWKKIGRRSLLWLAAIYVGVCVAVYIFQKRIVYNPTKAADLSVKEFGFAPQQAEDLSTKTSDGIMLHGWRIMGPSGHGKLANSKSVLLFFTGKGGNRSWHDGKFQRLAALGADVVCFDYRGYGDSGGSPDEEGLGRDAHAAWDFLRHEGVKPESVVLYGESLGTGVATRLAAELSQEHTPPAGMILEGAFARLDDPAKHLFFWLPVSLILTQHFPSIERMPQTACPLLMIHGVYDHTVPLRMGRELFDVAPPECRGIAKRFVECPNSGHVNLDTADAVLYQQSLKDFLGAVLALHAAHKKDDPKEHEKRAKRDTYLHAVKPK